MDDQEKYKDETEGGEQPFAGMTEEEIIARLLDADSQPKPEVTAKIKRLGIPIVLQAITDKTLENLRKRCTTVHRNKEKFDDELFRALILVAGSVSPNWDDKRLLEKYQASGPEIIIRKLLLPGEAKEISNIILDLSGYADDAVEQLKNE
jgi:hypothetical protein